MLIQICKQSYRINHNIKKNKRKKCVRTHSKTSNSLNNKNPYVEIRQILFSNAIFSLEQL